LLLLLLLLRLLMLLPLLQSINFAVLLSVQLGVTMLRMLHQPRLQQPPGRFVQNLLLLLRLLLHLLLRLLLLHLLLQRQPLRLLTRLMRHLLQLRSLFRHWVHGLVNRLPATIAARTCSASTTMG